MPRSNFCYDFSKDRLLIDPEATWYFVALAFDPPVDVLDFLLVFLLQQRLVVLKILFVDLFRRTAYLFGRNGRRKNILNVVT